MTRKNALVALVICLSVSSCQHRVKWDWEPRPYVGDSKTQSMIDQHGQVIKCNETRFDDMTGFDSENIAELSAAIDNLDVGKKTKKAIYKALAPILRRR